MATQAQINQLNQQNKNIRGELEKSIKRVAKIREYNEELNDKNKALETALAVLGNFKNETDKELDKTNLLLDMCRGREKQANRDIGSMRMIYGDLFEDMMNRQVGMAAAGWDKYYERKQKARKGADDDDS